MTTGTRGPLLDKNAVSINKSTNGGEAKKDVTLTVTPAPIRPLTFMMLNSLPLFRFVNVVQGIILVDAIVSLTLWLTGGNPEYYVHNIVQFHLTESTFDLAITSALKSILLVPLYSQLEETLLKVLDSVEPEQLHNRAWTFRICIIVLKVVFLVFSGTKGSLVLYTYLFVPNYPGMHPVYYALVISAFSFSVIEFLLCLWSFLVFQKLGAIRTVRRVTPNDTKKETDGANFRRLLKLAKPECCLIFGGTLALLVNSAANVVSPIYFGVIVDSAQKSMDALNMSVLTLAGVYLAGAVTGMVRSAMFVLAGQRLVARFRQQLFGAILRQDIAFFDETRTGGLCSRLSSDTQVVQSCLTENMALLFKTLLQIIGSLVLMFALNASLTGVLLSVVPVVTIGTIQYGNFLKKCRSEFQGRLADAGSHAEESFSNIRTVRMFSAEVKVRQQYEALIDKSYQLGRKMALIQGGFNGVMGVAIQTAILLILWYGGKLLHDDVIKNRNDVTPGILTSFLMYTLQVSMYIGTVSSVFGSFMQAVGASGRIFKLIDRCPEVDVNDGIAPHLMDGGVEFRNVDFSYSSQPDTKILKNLSFHVEPGKMLALVGPSGGGKSTIVSLIERFYDPVRGSVLLSGHDLKTLDSSWYRRQIALVSQEPNLFACSIRENIAYGRLASDQEVVEAAKKANAHTFITKFRSGYDTKVGARGLTLSGGQKQRIAIARALIMDPAILLLDEATSALDAESEHLVQEAIDRAMAGRTVIVVAHRLSTVRNAHKVIVIDKGEIVEEGTHAQLLNQDGVYKRLVLRQLMTSDKNREQIQNDVSSNT